MDTPAPSLESGPVLPPPQACAASRTCFLPDPREKSVPFAILLSSLPGLGQAYVGCVRTAFTHILVVGATISVLNMGPGPLEPLLGLFLAFFWIFSMVDAGRRAKDLNGRLRNQESLLPADELGLKPGLGMLLAGVGLVVLGALSLAHTLLGFSLEWMRDWWPTLLILGGGYLIWKQLPKRKLEG